MAKKIRVLIAKPGLDGHETGAKLVARVLRDAGMEVIYTGPRQTAEMIVQAAMQEDVDIIGLSILSGSHKECASRVVDLLREKGIERTPLIMGGIIPQEDIPVLKSLGVKGVFGPGTRTQDIVEFLKKEHKRMIQE
jgi:methylmalonyl-CoA mutase C-terminal domain/subunit